MELRDTARALDGRELAVTRFTAAEPAWATCVVANAMGVRQDFYAAFARYLASNGIHALTFDYRGAGWSRPHDLATLQATLTDWVELDFEAMLAEARRAAPGLPLVLVGHSLGGQILGLAPSNADVQAAVHVTVGSGYHRLNDRMRLRLAIFWFLAVPLLTPLFGYFPGKALRMVGDLPRGVVLQWRRWCMDPRYALGEGERARSAFERVTAPILSWSFEDDEIIRLAAVESLHSFYRSADVEMRHLTVERLGAKRVGHFGFFAEKSRDPLWSDTLAWLRSRLVP